MSKRTVIFLVNLFLSLLLIAGFIFVFIFAVPMVAELYSTLGNSASNFWFTFSDAVRSLWFLIIPVISLLMFGASYVVAILVSRLSRKHLLVLYAAIVFILLLMCGGFYAVIVLIPTYSIGYNV